MGHARSVEDLGPLLSVGPAAARPAAGAQSTLEPLRKGGTSTEKRRWTNGQRARKGRGGLDAGHPPPARPPPARCGAAGTSAGAWSPSRGSPRSLGAGWRRCGSSGRSCPCAGPACCPGPCTSARASGCWTARSGSLRATRARLSVPGTRRRGRPGRSRAWAEPLHAPVFTHESRVRDAHPCRWLTMPRAGAAGR